MLVSISRKFLERVYADLLSTRVCGGWRMQQGPSGTRGVRDHFDMLLFSCCLEEVGKYTKCREMQGRERAQDGRCWKLPESGSENSITVLKGILTFSA